MTALRARDLNRRIEVRHPIETANGKGGFVWGWSDPPLGLWAEVKGFASSSKGDEVVAAGALKGVFYYRIRVRFREDIGPKDQLRYAGKDLNVTAAYDPDGKREQLVIIADTESTIETS